ncbi:VWA domain-containing protein [Pedosphaera parvula]|uniref:VWA containing CoxE family protein n=1 Tax=Pedosphaera parvula (strain Ellin514) TaxID=320771 RepID=B9XDN5_PEDPL|nr:VWA domain-containing protein [Pedosphaera parvula]EEF62181.1 VWA containing CoxE family protein [Pedosphaera parvula Ellin514]
MSTATQNKEERLRRWRLVLGGDEADGTGFGLSGTDAGMDKALGALYESERKGGLGSSNPNVSRWLGDIRTYFPSTVVQVMQKDALERLNLQQMLLEPELLQAVQPDVHLVANLLALKNIMPSKTRETARMVVRKVVEELERKLANPMRQAVMGSLNRATRNRRPRHNEIDWNRTIRANLKHYQPEYRTIVPETRIGYGRKRSSLRDIILCVDQSGSMATSVVYAGIFSAVLASLPAVQTRMVVFDTAVVDLSDKLSDPVDVLFGTQLGGGTDINKALSYCQGLIRQPQDTILVLISDLYEGGNSKEMLKRMGSIVAAGTQVVTLLALNDDGAPMFDHQHAAAFAGMEIPSFACTPDLFPELMAAAISKQDIGQWAATRNVAVTK